MFFFKNLFIVVFNQIFRLKRRIVFFIWIVFVIKLTFFLISKLSSAAHNKLSKNDSKTFILYVDKLNDFDINTHSYMSDYLSIRKKLLNITLERNLKYGHIKKIIQDDRNPLRILKRTDYLIVEFTKFFYQTKYCHLFDQDFNKAKENVFLKECFYKNCVFSCDKSKVLKADALLFYDYDLVRESTESSIYIKSFLHTRKSRKDQIWILWNDEPNKVSNILDRYQMNWTISYRRTLFYLKFCLSLSINVFYLFKRRFRSGKAQK